MKTITVKGMNKGEVCANCFEYPESCHGCEFHNCAICKEELTDSECYEYRGAYSCEKCFNEVQEKRDYQRQQVMEVTEHSIKSQRNGDFINGNSDKIANDGLPIIKVNEPQILKDYEDGKL